MQDANELDVCDADADAFVLPHCLSSHGCCLSLHFGLRQRLLMDWLLHLPTCRQYAGLFGKLQPYLVSCSPWLQCVLAAFQMAWPRGSSSCRLS